MPRQTSAAGGPIAGRIYRLQVFTIVWMTAEAGVSLAAAWMAGSAALLGFGGDSAIELVSAVAVLWRFRSSRSDERDERLTARVTGVLLAVLAVYLAAISVLDLLGHEEPRPSYLGIAVLGAAAVVMPWLARTKRKLSARIGSAALRADAAEAGVCGYLSIVALVGLVMNAVWHIRWADPLAALIITPLIVREARESLRGRPCESC
jgi:divalent metal cation (Fe/Co/Zn/Cd) transporter